MVDHTSRGHALLSASSAVRWLACPPSARLEEAWVQEHPEKPSPYAEEGTGAHELVDLMIKCAKEQDPSKKGPLTKEIKKASQRLPDAAPYCIAFTSFVLEIAGEDGVIFNEVKVNYSDIAPEGFGTADVVIIKGSTLYVIDFKYGKGVKVEAEDNPQLRLYGYGAWRALSTMFDIEELELIIYQPRLDHISKEEITLVQLLMWTKTIVQPTAKMAYEGNGTFKSGEHCRFCKIRPRCRALLEEAENVMDMFDTQLPETMTNAELEHVLELARVLDPWFKDVEGYVLGEIMRGQSFEGWKAVEGRAVRKLDDPDAVLEELKNLGYMTEELYETKPKSLVQLAKTVSRDDYEAVVAEHVIKPEGKPTLAPANDKRPAITLLNDFEEEKE